MNQLDLYYLTRNIQWRYSLDQWEDEQLKRLLAAHDKAARTAMRKLEDSVGVDAYDEARARALLGQFAAMTDAVKAQVGAGVAEVAYAAAGACITEHDDILSLGGLVPGFNTVALAPEQLRSLIVDTPVGGRTLQGWVDRAYDLHTQERIKAEIEAGFLTGEGYGPLIRRVGEGMDRARHEVITLTRTYVQNVNVSAQEAVYRANPDVVQGVKWCATLEAAAKDGAGTCLRCAALDGKEWRYEEEGTRPHPPCPLHPRCLTPETPVFAPDKVAAFVAPYRGPVYEIGLSNGARFTVTPNHLFLTRDGFTPAKLLREGSKVFYDARLQGEAGGNPHDHGKPAPIKEVVESLAKTPGVSTVRVPASPEHLHGDGVFFDGYVDVIASDSLLKGDIEAFLAEHVCDGSIVNADMLEGALPSYGDFLKPLLWLRLATGGGIGGPSVSDVFLRRSECHHKAVGGGAVTYERPGLDESFSDYVARNPEAFSDGVFRFPTGVCGDDGPSINGDEPFGLGLGLPSHRLDSIALEHACNAADTNSMVLSDFAGSFSEQVTLADVLFCRERHFSGHVYDLQTLTTLYYVSGAISSNCRCLLLPSTVSWRELGIPIDDFEAAVRPYTQRGAGNIDAGGKRLIEEVGFDGGDYASWFARQPAARQANVLGPTRFELYRNSGYTLEDFLTPDGELIPVKALKRGEKGGI